MTSPEPKARETAELVAAALGLPEVNTVEGLREHDDRDVPFLSDEAFRTAVRECFARPNEAVFGPESAARARARFAAAVDGLSLPSAGASNVVVAHGRVIALFVAKRAELQAYSLWERLGLPSFVVLALPGHEVIEIVDSV